MSFRMGAASLFCPIKASLILVKSEVDRYGKGNRSEISDSGQDLFL